MTGEMSFKCQFFFFKQYCQESYLEQKSMVKRFCKNSNQILVVNYFYKKAPW